MSDPLPAAASDPAGELISVIIPAHNAAPFLGATLASALKQTHRAIEVIVVDDGSTDATAKVAAEAAAHDPRVRVIRTDNRGPSAARNLGIAHSSGALLAPLDADDLWHPEKLELQLAALRRVGAAAGVAYCWSVCIDEQDNVLMYDWVRHHASGRLLGDMIAYGFFGNGSSPLIRRSVFDAVGGYDPDVRLSEDWKLYIALAAITDLVAVPRLLVGYRFHPVSATMKLEPLERSMAAVTIWAQANWPHIPSYFWRLREYNVQHYLAFLAVRQRAFGRALRHELLAQKAKPEMIVSRPSIEFWCLFVGHMIGLRYYRWSFWRGPSPVSELFARTSRQNPT